MANSFIRRLLRELTPYSARDFVQAYRYRRRYPQAQVDRRAIVVNSSLGRSVHIWPAASVTGSTVGDYSYIRDHATVRATTIGRFCSIAPGAMIGLENHPSRNFVSTHPAFYMRNPDAGYTFADEDAFTTTCRTQIGNDVWIGSNVAVKGGIAIADGAIVGAGAVVTKDVPPYAIVGGVPAKLIRYRFDSDTIDYLLHLRWWDRSDVWLRENAHLFHDVDALRASCLAVGI